MGDHPTPGVHLWLPWIAAAVVAANGCAKAPETLSFLPPVEELRSLDIQDTIRSPQAESKLFPIEARYTLQRAASGFAGQAVFSVGSVSPRKATANVLVPFDALREFLRAVSGLSIRQGYEPQTPAVGGAFPDVRIELKGQTRTLALFTRSPGAGLLPWGVEYDSRTYTIESNVPPKAFAALQPYLKREVLETLTQAVTSSPP